MAPAKVRMYGLNRRDTSTGLKKTEELRFRKKMAQNGMKPSAKRKDKGGEGAVLKKA